MTKKCEGEHVGNTESVAIMAKMLRDWQNRLNRIWGDWMLLHVLTQLGLQTVGISSGHWQISIALSCHVALLTLGE